MSPKTSSAKKSAEQVVKDIRRATRRHFSAEDKFRIVLDHVADDPRIENMVSAGFARRPKFPKECGG